MDRQPRWSIEDNDNGRNYESRFKPSHWARCRHAVCGHGARCPVLRQRVPNGKHVAACVGNATQIAKARILGTNQNRDLAETDSRDINYQFSGCASFGDYWFKKDIAVRWIFGDGHALHDRAPDRNHPRRRPAGTRAGRPRPPPEPAVRAGIRRGQQGRGLIILGCTGMLGVAEELKTRLADKGFDVPVVDPTGAAITWLESSVASA